MPSDDMVMRKEERDLERRRANAEAGEKNFTNTFAKLMKDERVRKGLAEDALDATKSRGEDELIKKTNTAGGEIRRGYDDDDVITGKEEAIKRLLGEKYEIEVWDP